MSLCLSQVNSENESPEKKIELTILISILQVFDVFQNYKHMGVGALSFSPTSNILIHVSVHQKLGKRCCKLRRKQKVKINAILRNEDANHFQLYLGVYSQLHLLRLGVQVGDTCNNHVNRSKHFSSSLPRINSLSTSTSLDPNRSN